MKGTGSMAKYLMTHSLLSAWLYLLTENPYDDSTTEDRSVEDFLRVLRREPTETTQAMQNGLDFENDIALLLEGKAPEHVEWFEAEKRIADRVKGGILQCALTRTVTVSGTELLLYGRLDALKAGTVYDFKFSGTYDRGKYFGSTQHPMYLELEPEAKRFTYLVSNGKDLWTETYRRDETRSIIPTIADFLRWLEATGTREIYEKYWRSK